MKPRVHSINDIVETSRQSRPVVYDAINRGHLRTFVVGRRRFARDEDVRSWLDFLQAESDAGRPVKYRGRKVEREVA